MGRPGDRTGLFSKVLASLWLVKATGPRCCSLRHRGGPNPVSRQGENILTWDACRGDDGSALADDQPSSETRRDGVCGFISSRRREAATRSSASYEQR